MTKALTTVKDKVWARVRKAPDLELHVKTTRAADLELVNIRDYIPSTKKYGRGVIFPTSLLGEVIDHLVQLQRYLGGSNGKVIDPGPDQGKLDV